jgi:hypothetical protein
MMECGIRAEPLLGGCSMRRRAELGSFSNQFTDKCWTGSRMMLAARTFNEVCDEVRLLGRRSGGRAGDLGVARLCAMADFR